MKCHSYPHHLKDMLQDMMSSDTFTDVTLMCDDQKQLKAHKVILSAFSSVFKNIFTQNNLPLIYLRGIQGRYNGRILGKKSEIRPNALFWSEFGGIFKSSEKFRGI